jgi:hypothetical protein
MYIIIIIIIFIIIGNTAHFRDLAAFLFSFLVLDTVGAIFRPEPALAKASQGLYATEHIE